MTVFWIFVGVCVLIAFAAAGEAWIKRNQRKPLSHLSQGRRRYDDPNRPNQNETSSELDVKTYMNCCLAISNKSWKVANDPEGYAKVMMPQRNKGQSK